MNRLRVVLWGLVAVTFLAAGAMAAWRVWQGQAGKAVPTAQQTAESLIKTDFDLLDHAGQRRSAADFHGQWMLVFFGYTFCPDVCPTTLATVSAILDELGPPAERLQPLFVTVDPERDSPQVLADYVQAFHPRIVGLTGSAEEIARTAANYRVYYAKVEQEDVPGGYVMDHSAFIYLVDPQGRFVQPFSHQANVDETVAVLREYLEAGS
jgi:protein SCO1/2